MSHNPIEVNYSNEKIRLLVEEYITQQKSKFTLQCVCSYVLYWAMEDGHTKGVGLYESNQLAQADCGRISAVLDKIVTEGRLVVMGEQFQKITN